MSAPREVSIDINKLKSNFSNLSSNVDTQASKLDYMLEYLDNYKKMCQRRRDAYNLHSVKCRHKHNIVSIPLLIVTSSTGVLAGLNMERTVVTCLGAASAVLTAIQRFCSYSERAENARMVSKGFSRIVRKVEDNVLHIKSSVTTVDIAYFTKQIEDIQKEFDSVLQQAAEIPWELLQYVNTVDSRVWCFYPVFGPNKEVPKIPDFFG